MATALNGIGEVDCHKVTRRDATFYQLLPPGDHLRMFLSMLGEFLGSLVQYGSKRHENLTTEHVSNEQSSVPPNSITTP